MNLAVAGTYPHISLQYLLVLISNSPLLSAENATAAKNNDGNISFSWAGNSGTGTAETEGLEPSI
jgi:hypothetical protein